MRSAFVVKSPNVSALRATNHSRVAEQIRAASSRASVPLRELLSAAGDSYGAVFTRIDCEQTQGVELLSQVDIFSTEPACRVIRRDSMPRPERHVVQDGQVLIAAAGQVGQSTLFGHCVIADSRLVGKYLGPHVFALTFRKEHLDAHFVYAYLASALGLALIRATAYGTSVPSVREDLLLDIPVPLPSRSARERISVLVADAILQRGIFARELSIARQRLEDLPEMQAASSACGRRIARAGIVTPTSGTLNAWNYVSAGDAIAILRDAWPMRLGHLIEKKGIGIGPRFSRIPCEPPFGVEMLTQRDVFLIRPFPQRIVRPPVANDDLFAKPGTLLLGGVGTLGEGEIFGRVVLADEALEARALTGDVLRINPKEGAAEVLYAFLSTLVGRRLLRSTAAGTKLLRMRGDLLRELPVPDPSSSAARGIRMRVRAAYLAKSRAAKAEAEAVRIVEEEVMPAWLS